MVFGSLILSVLFSISDVLISEQEEINSNGGILILFLFSWFKI